MHTILAKQEKLLCQVNILARALRVPARRKSSPKELEYCMSFARGIVETGVRVARPAAYLYCTLYAYGSQSRRVCSRRIDTRTMGIGALLLFKDILTFT